MDIIEMHELAAKLGRGLVDLREPDDGTGWDDERVFALYETLLLGHTAGLIWFWGYPDPRNRAAVMDGTNRLRAIALLFDERGPGLPNENHDAARTVQFNVHTGHWRRASPTANLSLTPIVGRESLRTAPGGWVDVPPLLAASDKEAASMKSDLVKRLVHPHAGTEERDAVWDTLTALRAMRRVRQHVSCFHGDPDAGVRLQARLAAR